MACICCGDTGSVIILGVCPLCDGFGFLASSALRVVSSTASILLPDPSSAPVSPAAGGTVLLPAHGARNILITAALPYVNNVPHLGNIIGCVLSADVYARYCRSRGYHTLFVGGTDEYGTATEVKALEEGLSPQEICDKYHAVHAEIYKWFNISFNQFGRTSTPQQTQVVQSTFGRILENGWLEKKTTEQLYSEGLQRFLADRFVEGTCPRCRYNAARGDQCDNCGTLLNPTELLQPRCKQTGTTPVLKATRHLYLDLPGLQGRLHDFVSSALESGRWSANAQQVSAAWLRDGLRPRCITRDLKWGVPVPHEGFEEKVFYVWFDAPLGYVSITANYTPQWEKWWRAPDDVELVQFLGKDNIPFHTIIFPASLLATGDTWTLLDRISVTDYLNYEGGKFSKSRKVGIFGNDAQDTGIPPDVFRYYLLSIRPEHGDTDFRWSDLASRNNSELLKNLGNFCHRVLDFVSKRFGGVVPEASISPEGLQDCTTLGKELQLLVDLYINNLEKARLREGLKAALAISSLGNHFLTEHEPWKCVKNELEKASVHLRAAVGVVRLLAALLTPFVPTVAGLLLYFLGLDSKAGELSDELLKSVARPHELVSSGHVLGPRSQPIFSEISQGKVDEFRARFGGAQGNEGASTSSIGGS